MNWNEPSQDSPRWLNLTVLALGLAAVSYLAFDFSLTAIVTLGVVCVLSLVILSPDTVLYLYAASLFLFQVPAFHDSEISVPTIAGVLFLVAAGVRQLRGSVEHGTRSKIPLVLAILTALYLGLALVNPAWSFTHLWMTLTYFGLFATTWAASLELRNPIRAWRVSWVLCVGSAIVSLEAVYEGWTGHYNLAGLYPSHDERAYGLADPNFTAAFLVTMLPFIVANFVRTKNFMVKLLTAGLTLLSLVGIVMTASRGGAMGCLLVLLILALLFAFKTKSGTAVGGGCERAFGVWGRVGLLGLLIGTTVFAAFMAPQNMWTRLSTVHDWSDPKKEDRLQIWDMYLERWRESPWVGQGAGYLEEREMEPHNTPLQNLVEVGVLGLAGFLVLNAFALWESSGASRRFAAQGMHDMSALSNAVVASLIGFHCTGFFLTSARHKELWFLVGFAAALFHVAGRNPVNLLR